MKLKKVAAIYDIHGNLPALEAVLSEIHRLSVDAIVVGGDMVWGADPKGVLDCLSGLKEKVYYIRGNMDRAAAGIGDTSHRDMNEWCAKQLDDAQLAFLKNCPERLVLDIEGIGEVLFVHASPRSDEEGITDAISAAEAADMMKGVTQTHVVCGHTHRQMNLVAAGKRIVNAGSVGLPFDSPDAHWLLLGPSTHLYQTPYDVQSAVRASLSSQSPMASDFAHKLQNPATAN